MTSTRTNSHKLQFALAVSAALTLFGSSAQATTRLTLTRDPGQFYSGINVGPYPITLEGDNSTPALLAFCLDEVKTANFGASYDGTFNTPLGRLQVEAAFLAAYSLYNAPASPDFTYVNTVAGPISMAIWQIMGTLGGTANDPNAQGYVQLAVSAYNDNLITSTFLSGVRVFVPNTAGIQPFITAVRDDAMILSAIPEPGTWILLITGVALMVLGRRRLRV